MSVVLTEKSGIGAALRALQPGHWVVIPSAVAGKKTARKRAYQILGCGNYATRSTESGLLIWRSMLDGRTHDGYPA